MLNSSKKRVLSCIVSYRNPEAIRNSLKRHRELIIPDNYQLDICVVDNSESKLGVQKLTEITAAFGARLIVLEENLGVAAAYQAAAKVVVQEGYQFLWLWDQDSSMEKNCLSELLKTFESEAKSIQKLGVVAPKLVDFSGNDSYWLTSGPPQDLWGLRDHRLPMASLIQGCAPSTFVYNSGTLIRSELLADLGFPNADYFMDFVDFEFCARIYRGGWGILVCGNTQVAHAAGKPEKIELVDGIKIVARNHAPLRFYYMAKNEILLAYDYGDILLLLKSSLRIFLIAFKILFEKENQGEKLKAHFIGWRDGLLRIKGKSHPQWMNH